MNAAPRWSYVQARLQARHGERLSETDWRALEAAKAFDHFIERSRATALRRFTEHLNAGMTSHALERVLRLAWRGYVAEVAEWMEADWRPAVLWVGSLADLPTIDALLRGDVPAWVGRDHALAGFAGDTIAERIVALEKSPLAPLLAGKGREATLPRRWYAQWRVLWPRDAETRGLDQLAAAVRTYFELLARAGAKETSAPYRRDLMRTLLRLFRRHSAAPAAVFAHLALTALDLERLRGNLVRRRLFAAESAKEAA
jgi:hypothetical protein